MIHIDGTFGGNEVRAIVAEHEEFEDEFALTSSNEMDGGLAVPTSFSNDGAWINCVTVNNKNWVFKMVAVKFGHWPD